jgi:uncharacterized protein YdaU (DUF1376 family)
LTPTLSLHKTLTIVECGMCAIDFAMPATMHEKCVKDGSDFWCPNGHKIHYYETDNKRLKQQLAWARDETARARAARDQAEATTRAVKGHNTRLKKRAAAGVCPCCNRTFKQLARHMKSQHPEFPEEPTE